MDVDIRARQTPSLTTSSWLSFTLAMLARHIVCSRKSARHSSEGPADLNVHRELDTNAGDEADAVLILEGVEWVRERKLAQMRQGMLAPSPLLLSIHYFDTTHHDTGTAEDDEVPSSSTIRHSCSSQFFPLPCWTRQHISVLGFLAPLGPVPQPTASCSSLRGPMQILMERNYEVRLLSVYHRTFIASQRLP
ncbi:hypothetical protein BC826DRAFT_1177512 [Russula brevipes]|nr:hypothetical protein BC826DRAFT_1177512 [Russula brevipes]